MKKAILFFLILNCSFLIVNSLKAQTIQKLDSLMNVYTNAGKFDTAIVYAKKSLELIEQKDNKKFQNKISTCIILGAFYFNKLKTYENSYCR